MVPAETPAELNFRVNVTKSNVQTAWRTNGFTQTYLTDTTYSTGRFDDVLYVQDASKLVEVQNFTVSPDVNNVAVVAGITANQVTSIKIVDSSLNLITDYTLNPAEVNGTEYVTTNNSVLNILINQSYTGPLAVQLAIGNKIIVQSEQIEFTSVDLESVPNRVTGLKRGQNTTITNTVFNKYSTVQSVLNRDLMLEEQYAYSWYDEYAPLQLNNTPAALFLQQQNP
jgi:hypothetical protein